MAAAEEEGDERVRLLPRSVVQASSPREECVFAKQQHCKCKPLFPDLEVLIKKGARQSADCFL
jgi:hypothetical protein